MILKYQNKLLLIKKNRIGNDFRVIFENMWVFIKYIGKYPKAERLLTCEGHWSYIYIISALYELLSLIKNNDSQVLI